MADTYGGVRAIEPEISVVIPLHGARGFGLRGLQSWTGGQGFPRERFEVIAMSDGSDPELEQLASERFGARDRLIVRPGAGEIELWDAGARAAEAGLVILTEAHCIAEAECVGRLVQELRSGSMQLACCESVGVCETGIAWFENEIFDAGRREWAALGDPRMVSLRGIALSKDDYLAGGGLDQELGNFSERVLAHRLNEMGRRIGLARGARIRHYPNSDFPAMFGDACEFADGERAFRARSSALSGDQCVGPPPAWAVPAAFDPRANRAVCRAAGRGLLRRWAWHEGGRPARALARVVARHLPRAALGARAELPGAWVAAMTVRARIATGREPRRRVARDYPGSWERLMRPAYLRSAARGDVAMRPAAVEGRVSIADLPEACSIGLHPLERDPEGGHFRWTSPVAVLSLRLPAGTQTLRLETLPARPAHEVHIEVSGRGARVRATPDGLVLRAGPRGFGREVELTLACAPVSRAQMAPGELRALGLPLVAVTAA